MKWISRLWPEERIALLFFAGVAALFATRLYPFTLGPLVVSYFQFLLAITVFVLPPWMIVALVRRLRGRPLGAFLGGSSPSCARSRRCSSSSSPIPTSVPPAVAAPAPLRSDLRPPRRPAAHGRRRFRRLGRPLHAPSRSAALQLVYYYAWAALAIPLAVAMARSGVAVVRRTLAALALCYIAGGFLYLAFPSLGPALVERARYAALADTHIFGLQQSMLQALRFIVQNPQAPAVPFFGLAAFPSLHLATSALGLFVAWRTFRPLLLLLVPWNLAIAASAIYFGWHYVVDFYPALLLAWGGWWAAGRLVESRPEAGAT
jgi:hypothetical protein